MDANLEDIKRQVAALAKTTEDTNRQVHKMRRGIWWGRVWTLLFWLLVLGASGATYYYYVQPYVDKITAAYGNTKNLELQVQNFFAQFGQTKPK